MLAKNRTPGRKFSRKLVAPLIVVALSLVLTSIFASSAWAGAKYKTLHRFKRGDGFPYAGLIFDAAGNLYGTTQQSGSSYYGKVFELTPNADSSWKESVLHSFDRTDGSSPYAGLVFDSAGNLYGATYDGAGGYGTVFELTPDGHGSWTESVLHSFTDDGVDGMYPFARVIFDSAGNLYGTTGGGGAYYMGTVFELTPNGDGSWKESVLHSFNRDGKDGIFPMDRLIFDSSGNLYGTTERGGARNSGTVFELTPNKDGSWTESVLHSFKSTGTGGEHPYAGVIFDSAGSLYGTTSGGAYNYGTVFKLKPSANGRWTETVLHSFKDHPGAIPYCELIFDGQGTLYGTTSGDGTTTFGSVFEIIP